MPKRNTRWNVVGLGLVGLLGLRLVAMAAAPSSGANVGQVDINISPEFTATWLCPPGPSTMVKGPFTDVPGLALSLTTGGQPVLVMINITLHGTAGTGFWFDPVIDGQSMSQDRMAWQTGNDGFGDLFSFHRVYSLPAGTHTFGARMSCQNELLVYRAWLTVYELPPTKSR
jgi:hypothetical protein